MGIGNFRSQFDCLAQVIESVAHLAPLGQHHAHFHFCLGIARIKAERFLPVCDRSVGIPRQRQRHRKVVEPGSMMWIESTGFAIFRNRLALLIVATQRDGEGKVAHRVVRLEMQGLAPLFNRLAHLVLLHELECIACQMVELRCFWIDLLHAIRRNVHELRNVDGAIRGRGVIDENRRTVVTIRVDMRQHEPRIRPVGLR
ncbi:MAG TPA: hypothetical protein VMG31_06065 [Verrucomicrobiae bacterium]|nr:hypothetical protein [Verrucomicrobiae bacterium]